MTTKIQNTIEQIQSVQQNIETISTQKQQFQIELTEIDAALNEIKPDGDVYKIVGNLMIKTHSEDIKKDLEEKKQITQIRISSIEKQESRLKEKFENMQLEMMQELEKSKGPNDSSGKL